MTPKLFLYPSSATLCWFLSLAALPVASVAHADMYFNSGEPGCDGSNPDYLWCDDFEDGTWYGDQSVGGRCDNDALPLNDGWLGYCRGVDGLGNGNWATCGSVGAAGTNCAAISESHGGPQGWHKFRDGQEVTEFYFRYYVYFEPDSTINHEKMLGFGDNQGGGGAGGGNGYGGNADYGYANSAFRGNQFQWYNRASATWLSQNISQITFSGGNWYYIEFHVEMESPGQSNGVVEFWIDNCGSDGLGCTGPGTLRGQHAGLTINTAPGQLTGFGHMYILFWAPLAVNGASPPFSTGYRRVDQIIASKTRVGPMAGTPPREALAPPGVPRVLP